MGLDGFAIGNLGLNLDMTSAQMAVKAEQLAQRGTEVKIKDISELAEDNGVKRKDEPSDNQKHFKDGLKDKKKETEEDNKENQSQAEIFSTLNEKDFENRDPKEFSIRINVENDMVELFSNKEDKVLETMSANDLMGLVSKLSNASGVLVNRKI